MNSSSEQSGIEFATERPIICMQGMGFVGSAMAVAVASARSSDGSPLYNVIGVDLPNPAGIEKINKINAGEMVMESVDEDLKAAFTEAHQNGNFFATHDTREFQRASVVLVDIHLDVDFSGDEPSIAFSGFKSAMQTLGENINSDCLVIVETTVPPGTCERVVYPALSDAFKSRGIDSTPLLAHSYERVMPGAEYLSSIKNFWRVFSGMDEKAAEACEAFLSTIINIADYPLSRVHSTTASEIGKVLENSYRATTIAFMEEWGRFAEAVGVDLFQVIDAIRKRPTHSNMRQPGFGVGGYCLTKDPLFAKLAAREIFGMNGFEFPFCTAAVATNNEMPLVTLAKVENHFSGDVQGKRLLMLGVSYRQDVADTRYSPSEVLFRSATDKGIDVVSHDPLVTFWEEVNAEVLHEELPPADNFDAIVFTVSHREYRSIDIDEWLGESHAVIVDANCVLSVETLNHLKNKGRTVISIGRGN